MKYFAVLLLALGLSACGGFEEPNWLDEARALEKTTRPLCTRLAGALNALDKKAKTLKEQKQFDQVVASMQGQLNSAIADCKSRSKTYSN